MRKLFYGSGSKVHAAKLHSVEWGLLTRCWTQWPECLSPDTASGIRWNVFGYSTCVLTSECQWSHHTSSGMIFLEIWASCSCASLWRIRQTSWRCSTLNHPERLLPSQHLLLLALPPPHIHPQGIWHSGICRQCSADCPCQSYPSRSLQGPHSHDQTFAKQWATDLSPPALPPQETGPPPPLVIFSEWYYLERKLLRTAPCYTSPRKKLGRRFLRIQWDTPNKENRRSSASFFCSHFTSVCW